MGRYKMEFKISKLPQDVSEYIQSNSKYFEYLEHTSAHVYNEYLIIGLIDPEIVEYYNYVYGSCYVVAVKMSDVTNRVGLIDFQHNYIMMVSDSRVDIQLSYMDCKEIKFIGNMLTEYINIIKVKVNEYDDIHCAVYKPSQYEVDHIKDFIHVKDIPSNSHFTYIINDVFIHVIYYNGLIHTYSYINPVIYSISQITKFEV